MSEEVYQDAYWLAYAYFLSHQYQKAIALLTAPLPAQKVSFDRPHNPGDPVEITESDALADALAGTRMSSALIERFSPARDRRTRRGKRKERSFTVSGTGSGSEISDSDDHPSEEDVKAQKYSDEEAMHRVSQRSNSESDLDERWLADSTSCLQEIKAQERPEAEGPCLVSYSQACRYLTAQCLVRSSSQAQSFGILLIRVPTQVRVCRFHEALDLLGRDPSKWRGACESAMIKGAFLCANRSLQHPRMMRRHLSMVGLSSFRQLVTFVG